MKSWRDFLTNMWGALHNRRAFSPVFWLKLQTQISAGLAVWSD